MIEVLIARSTTEHRARESEVLHTSLKFKRGVFGCGGRQRSDTFETCGMGQDSAKWWNIGQLRK
jgi:hypothetical protein